MTEHSLKEYYVNLQGLYENAVNMLTAINQSLTTTSPEVSVSINNSSDNSKTSLRLPSFLYLENKVEELSLNMGALFKMPKSGEAWFTQSSDMYRLNMVRSNTTPLTPEVATDKLYASLTDNNILKDMVAPKMFIRANITNLPENIEKMIMHKIVFYDKGTFDNIVAMNLTSYDEYVAALYNLTKGVNYDEYDSVLSLPIKRDKYVSEFNILDIVKNETLENGTIQYEIIVDTLEYTDKDDKTQIFTLSSGTRLVLGNEMNVFVIKSVNKNENRIIIEEEVGHITLMTTEENSAMKFYLYNYNYSDYNYIDIPLEENQYVCVFLGTIYNNVRSNLSNPLLLDLSKILMYDKYGSKILDSYGNQYNYLTYYNEYCNNIGDLILGLSQIAYPQVSNFTPDKLQYLQDDESINNIFSTSLNTDTQLEVVPINKHLVDDVTTEKIINLHAQKNELNSQLSNVQENIDQVYNTLVTTDFSQELSITQTSLKAQLDNYYSERITLQKQIIAVVNEINSNSIDLTVDSYDTKYRIRGVVNIDTIENYIHSSVSDKCDIIGIDVEYKYKSTTKDTTSVININSNIFTDWNKLNTIDRQRKLEFNSQTNVFKVIYDSYETTENKIKWNQIDIPIKQGEDVVIRIRLKYNIGQPFINLYSKWSNEITVVFPAKYENNTELTSILSDNANDTISAKFDNVLINQGYEEHINNKLTTGEQTFFHMPENIYSGFNTPENNMISLKDKLQSMMVKINEYEELFKTLNPSYEIYLTYDQTNIKLTNSTANNINILNQEHISDTFIAKDMNIVIKNTSNSPLKLYSILPGPVDQPLLTCNIESYSDRIKNYERVPIIINNEVKYQTLGQWIYFRQNNPWTYNDLYFNTAEQRTNDMKNIKAGENVVFISTNDQYLAKDNLQVLLGYKKHNTLLDEVINYINSNNETNSNEITESDNPIITIDKYIYENNGNNYLTRYEDIYGISKNIKTNTEEEGVKIYLDQKTSISEFLTTLEVTWNGSNSIQTDALTGGFLYPNIDSNELLIISNNDDNNSNNYNSISIDAGETLSIPIRFEFFLPIKKESSLKTITKSLCFDIRTSINKDPEHYILNITGNYDATLAGDISASRYLEYSDN